MTEEDVRRLQDQIDTLKGNGLALELMLGFALGQACSTPEERARCADFIGDLFEAVQLRYRLQAKPAFHDGVQDTFANVARVLRSGE